MYKSYLAASIPSQVEDSLMRILSLLMPSFSYSSMNLRPRAIMAFLSKDSLKMFYPIEIVLEKFSYLKNT